MLLAGCPATKPRRKLSRIHILSRYPTVLCRACPHWKHCGSFNSSFIQMQATTNLGTVGVVFECFSRWTMATQEYKLGEIAGICVRERWTAMTSRDLNTWDIGAGHFILFTALRITSASQKEPPRYNKGRGSYSTQLQTINCHGQTGLLRMMKSIVVWSSVEKIQSMHAK